jgi:hypothetical protein
LTAVGVLPGGSGTAIRHNTQDTKHTKYHTALKEDRAHKATQTIKNTLHTIHEYNTKK